MDISLVLIAEIGRLADAGTRRGNNILRRQVVVRLYDAMKK